MTVRTFVGALASTLVLAGCHGPPLIGTAPSPTRTPSPSPPAGAPARYAFPVDGESSYGRTHSLYPATDIIARCGAIVRSPVDGVVLELSRVDTFVKARPQGAARGGLSVSIRGDDGVRYYASHLSRVDAPIKPGLRLRAGAPIGLVGRTGNANNVCHVHFALSPLCEGTGDWWIRRGVVYPWPYLDSWRRGGQLSPAREVGRKGCPAAP
jgi:murein DD-endopeptidase MepM/ murein hydrolase activator NlpD